MMLSILNPRYVLEAHRKYSALRAELTELIQATPSHYPPDQRVTQALGGKINFPYAIILTALLEKYRPNCILEIGSFVGFSTRWMLQASAPWNATVTSLDPNIRHRIFDEPQAILRKLNANFSTRLEIEEAFFGPCGDCVYHDYENYEPRISRTAAESLVAAKPVLDGSWDRKFDFIFIDGDHEQVAVEHNFRSALPLLREGGCIAFHDVLLWKGVDDVIRNLQREFDKKAIVKVYGRITEQILKRLGRNFGGIGFFKMLPRG